MSFEHKNDGSPGRGSIAIAVNPSRVESEPNPYAPPSAVVADNHATRPLTDRAKLYTPSQIRAGTYLGGPLAAAYFLRQNFLALDRYVEAEKTVMWGGAAVVAVLAVAPFMPAHFPNYLIPILYSVMAGFVADKWQLSKKAIVQSDAYGMQSNWRVVGISTLLMIPTVLILFVELMALRAVGWIHA